MPSTDPPAEPRQMTTYRRADGEPIFGEFSFTTDKDGLVDEAYDEPVRYIEERWVLAGSHEFWQLDASDVCQFDVNDDGEWCEAEAVTARDDGAGPYPVCAKHKEGSMQP